MNLAYVRVSTEDQNEARQVEALKRHGIDKWFMEKVSAKNTEREQLKLLLDFCREGDTIFVHDFSRLARNTGDLLKLIEFLEKKSVHLVSNKENIDSGTPTGKLMLTMIGAINEFERTNLLERQKEGIEIAKKKGVYKGRKRIEIDPAIWKELMQRYQRREIDKTQIARELHISRNTLYRLMERNKKRSS